MEDFSRCIWSSLQEDVRRNHLNDILRFHYSKLKEYLGKEPPFSFDSLMKAFHRLTRYGCLGALGVLVMVPMLDPVISKDEAKKQKMFARVRHILDDVIPHITD